MTQQAIPQEHLDFAAGHLAMYGYKPTDTLDTEQAATVLDSTPTTLQTWRITGAHRIPFIKLGRKVRYPAKGLIEYLAGRVATNTGKTKC